MWLSFLSHITMNIDSKLNPLTQNRMLSLIIDATGRRYNVTTTDIDQGQILTNIQCQLVTGIYPIPRIGSVSGAGIGVKYEYRGKGREPFLESATISASGAKQRRWEYQYNGDKHITTVKDPNNCADKGGKPYLTNIYDVQGKYAQAETIQDQILEIQRRVLGEERPDTLKSMNNLALTYLDEGKYAQAEVLHAKVLEIQRRLLGEDHLDTLTSMINLGLTYFDPGCLKTRGSN